MGGSEKNEINAILNSVEVKVEVGVELGNMLNKCPSQEHDLQKSCSNIVLVRSMVILKYKCFYSLNKGREGNEGQTLF